MTALATLLYFAPAISANDDKRLNSKSTNFRHSTKENMFNQNTTQNRDDNNTELKITKFRKCQKNQKKPQAKMC